jgi:hypothetical protein
MQVNARGKQVKYKCTIGMGKMFSALEDVVMHMDMREHVHNMHIEL